MTNNIQNSSILCVVNWSIEDTKSYLEKQQFSESSVKLLCEENKLDGKCLLALNDNDFMVTPISTLNLHDRKSLYILCKSFQRLNQSSMLELGLVESPNVSLYTTQLHCSNKSVESEYYDTERISPPASEDGRIKLPPEKLKACLSFIYVVAVTWITAFVMVIVHDRVPDMKKYPPLPDIFLDNVPHIPWAFDMCEVTGTVMFTIWLVVLLFHKHRASFTESYLLKDAFSDTCLLIKLTLFFGVLFTLEVSGTFFDTLAEIVNDSINRFILMRRFFALSGTVFLLRCVTMLITSLSVPGAHLQCKPRNYPTHRTSAFSDLSQKLSQAYVIWRGAGMSIQGVRTCGDYMFSGHTVALTMLNFFITEYTPRQIYHLQTLSWMMNMFGIFFILAAHEHYSIDVFVAFYITSRLFLYYHTLANNQALMQRDSNRTKVWFPLFSYFESSVEGIVINEYNTPREIANDLVNFVKETYLDFKALVYEAVKHTTSRHVNVSVNVSNSECMVANSRKND